MKRLFSVLAFVFLLVTMVACVDKAPQETTSETTSETTWDATEDTSENIELNLDIMGGDYKIVCDMSDAEIVDVMTGMIDRIVQTSNVTFESVDCSDGATAYEIQFGIISGRPESEALYNEISGYSDDTYGAYAIRAIEGKVIVVASDIHALGIAADRFADKVLNERVIQSDFNEVAIFNLADFEQGNVDLIYFDEFGANNDVLEFTVGGKTIKAIDGKYQYYRALEGNTTLPQIAVKTQYPSTIVEITKDAYCYEIKVKSADDMKEETYKMNFLETAPLDSYDLNTWLIPYWDSGITYHESIMFVGDDGAPLLHSPEYVLSVRSYDLKTEYI